MALHNNTTLQRNLTKTEVLEVFPDTVEAFIRLAYCLCTLIGIVGNGLVFSLISTKKVDRTPFNLLLANLAAADFLADISLYPYVFIDIRGVNSSPLTGQILCNFTVGLSPFFVCTFVSLFTLTTISINRYICINHPFRFEWQQSKRTVKITVIFAWLLGIVSISPNIFSFTYKKEWGVCHREWPEAINGMLYSLFTSFLALIVPLAVLLYTFIATIKSLKTKVSDLSISRQTDNSRKKTIRLLAWLLVVFCICWTPFFIYWLLSRSTNVFKDDYKGDYQRMRVIRVTILVASFNTAADPLLYALFSEQYRGALKKMFKRSDENLRRSVTLTSAFSAVPRRMRTITVSERSSFSMKALDEEFRGQLTPKSSMVMAHIRASSSLSQRIEVEGTSDTT